LIKDTRVRTQDLVRIVSLYAMRYEKSSNSELSSLKELLLRRGALTEQEREVEHSSFNTHLFDLGLLCNFELFLVYLSNLRVWWLKIS